MKSFPTNPDVVVIGAGVAGLSAANALRHVGMETVVLEAAGHVGGRCVTDQNTFSIPFDRGGAWLHSAPINPLARIAENQGAVLHKSGWEWAAVHSLGYDLTETEVSDYQTYHQNMWPAINAAGSGPVDCTTKSAVPDGPWAKTATHWIAQHLSGDGDFTSARDSFNYADDQGDWLVEGGLGKFVRDLFRDVPVCLNCAVSKVDYSGPEVVLTTSQGTVRAKQVIVTVSTSVLAAGSITFVPALPVAKSEAIDNLPTGLLNKVGIEFDPDWAQAFHGQIADYHSAEDEFTSIHFGFYQTGLATAFIAGRFADALEAEGAGAATDYCLSGLREMFGNSALKHIRKTDETAWRKNLNTLGSYSYAKPGCTGAREILAAPLDDRVFFAGEATMIETYSTVHGAYLSGLRAADEIGKSCVETATAHQTREPEHEDIHD